MGEPGLAHLQRDHATIARVAISHRRLEECGELIGDDGPRPPFAGRGTPALTAPAAIANAAIESSGQWHSFCPIPHKEREKTGNGEITVFFFWVVILQYSS